MQSTKTYTKRENAKRAAVAAGVAVEQVEITVHKTLDEVRFGWKQIEAPAPVADAAPVVTTASKPKQTAAPESAPKQQRIEQNGVKRPGLGKCLEVWEWLDENGNCMPKDLRPVAEAKGWNQNNAQIELYQWRKFNGITGRQAKAAK